MEFTNDLKKKLESAKTADEKKQILDTAKADVENAGVILSDEDLDNAAGGCFSHLPPRK